MVEECTPFYDIDIFLVRLIDVMVPDFHMTSTWPFTEYSRFASCTIKLDGLAMCELIKQLLRLLWHESTHGMLIQFLSCRPSLASPFIVSARSLLLFSFCCTSPF